MALIKVVGMRRLDFIDDKRVRHEFRSDAATPHFIEDRHLDDPWIQSWIKSGNVVVVAMEETERIEMVPDHGEVPEVQTPLPPDRGEVPEVKPPKPKKGKKGK